MELILREDVQNLGFKDDIVKVKNGYGRNFLIPHGKAVIATSSARKVLAENLKQRAFKEQKLVDDANKLGKKLQGFEIKIKSKVGSGDKLFGSIGSQDVADAFEKNGETIEKKFITLAQFRIFSPDYWMVYILEWTFVLFGTHGIRQC
jgi:large subunit ribosomal protein L9